MGVDRDLAMVTKEEKGTFCHFFELKNISDNFQWCLFNVYGPVQDNRKAEFLNELAEMISTCLLPFIMGGDFNLVRRVEDKTSGNVDVGWMQAFNDLIDRTAIKELHRGGSRYTWSNKQVLLVQSVLDRVFVNNTWEDRYNLVRVYATTRVGSDHNPLIVCLEEEMAHPPRYFRFDPMWLTQDGFKDWLISRWPSRFKIKCLDHWHVLAGKLRKSMKGWGANFESDMRKNEQQLLASC